VISKLCVESDVDESKRQRVAKSHSELHLLVLLALGWLPEERNQSKHALQRIVVT
jgi:Ser-tRNA(Ala) deacylase AlaX